jgi:hypothetical protein
VAGGKQSKLERLRGSLGIRAPPTLFVVNLSWILTRARQERVKFEVNERSDGSSRWYQGHACKKGEGLIDRASSKDGIRES